VVRHSEDEFLGEMSQIQPFFLGQQANPPLLHREGAKEHVDCSALFVMADLVDDISVGGNIVPFDSCDPARVSAVGTISTTGTFDRGAIDDNCRCASHVGLLARGGRPAGTQAGLPHHIDEDRTLRRAACEPASDESPDCGSLPFVAHVGESSRQRFPAAHVQRNPFRSSLSDRISRSNQTEKRNEFRSTRRSYFSLEPNGETE
jgi:hypothetical protein